VGVAYVVDAFVLPWWRRRGTTTAASSDAVDDKKKKAKAAAADGEADSAAELKEALAGIGQSQKELLRSLADLTQTLRDQQQQATTTAAAPSSSSSS